VIALWAVTATTTICLVALGGEQRRVGRAGLVLMAVPTFAIAAQFSANELLTGTPVLRAVFVVVFLAAMVLAFPYTPSTSWSRSSTRT
jgi:N12 class adenine-specific DNA methylase